MLDVETRNPQEPATLPLRSRGLISGADARMGAGVFALLLLLTVSIGMDRALWRVGDINIRFELLAGVVTLAALIVYYRRSALAALGLVEWLLIAWVGLNFFSSAAFALSPGDSLRSSLVLVGLVSIYLSLVLLVRSRAALEWAAKLWVATGAVVALLGLVDAVLYALFGSTHGISLHRTYADGVLTVVPMVTGTIWEPNLFGAYTLATGLVAASLSLSPEPGVQGRRWAFLLAVGICFTGVILSMTRTVWFVAVAAGVVLFTASLVVTLRRGERSLFLWPAAAAAGAALGIAVALAMPRIAWTTSDPWEMSYAQLEARTTHEVRALRQSGSSPQTAASAISGRLGELNSWESAPTLVARQTANATAIELWRERPWLGWGTDGYRQAARPEPHAPAWIPNVVLHILFDTGIIGLLIATVAVAVGIGSAVRALAKSPRRWGSVDYTLLGLLVACGALALSYQMTDGTWLGFTWFLFALLVVSARHTSGSRQVT